MAKVFITATGNFSQATDGSNITVEAIGGGGGGHAGDANVGTGGGGGAYATKVVAYVSLAVVPVVIGAAGLAGADGGDTNWNGGVVIAKGGQGGQGGAGGTGGSAAACTPAAGAFSGGNGGGIGANNRCGGGGGGAAGPGGNGKNGGDGGASAGQGGGGGGGAAGGASTVGGVSGEPSGAGGTGPTGTAGGAPVAQGGGNGLPGSNGSGGSGGGGDSGAGGGNGGTGGAGIDFDATHGSGGGAGGGAGRNPTVPGNGGTAGLYGGGGGGGGFSVGTGGSGAQGIIVVTFTPAAAVTISCNAPPDAVIGVAYSHTFPTTGTTPPNVFSITVGSLPSGLTLDAATGIVSGTPLGPAGTSNFTIQVVDSLMNTATAACSITVDAALGITCNAPPAGEIGLAYSHFFPATGGVAPYTFAITVGALPTSLVLNAATGEVHGTPTVAGVFNFTIQVTDSYAGGAGPNTASVACSITIDAALAITCGAPPSGFEGIAYSHFFPGTGGDPPLTYAITAGALPTGLTLNAATGEVSGIPTTAGVFTFTIRVTDSLAVTASVECSITIASNLALACGDPPVGYVGVAYSHTCPASGGTTPYVFSISAGMLPPGLSIAAGTGVISGTPTTKGVYSFTVLLTDNLANTVSVDCSIAIRGKCLVD